MQQLLHYTGNLAGGLGVLLCIAAGLARLFGAYYLAGYGATTVFSVGTGLMVFACLVKLQALVDRPNQ